MKTHSQVLETFETRLIDAIIRCDLDALRRILHPDIVHTNETGEVFRGIGNLQLTEPDIISYRSIDIVDRTLSFFNNVAIVNSQERRTGHFRGLYFEREYSITRIWKFDGRSWQLIGSTGVLL